MLGGESMKYEQPSIQKIEVDMKVNLTSSEITSCAGGHCVKTRYGQDQQFLKL